MTTTKGGVRALRAVLLAVTMLQARVTSAVDQSTVDQLMHELEAMKRRLEKVEKRTEEQQRIIQQQNETIQRLSGQKAPPAPAPAPAPVTAGAPTPTTTTGTAASAEIEKTVTESVLRRIQPALAAANKTFPSQFNPAIGLVIDSVASYSSKQGGNFDFRSAEIALSAEVDPFVRGWA